MKRFNELMNVVRDACMYSIFEIIFLFVLLVDKFADGVPSEVTMTIGGFLAVLWTVASMSRESHAEAWELVMDGELFPTDFGLSAAVLILIALVIHDQPWYYVVPFGLAIGQNLRYSWLSYGWIRDYFDEYQRRNGHGGNDTDDNVR